MTYKEIKIEIDNAYPTDAKRIKEILNESRSSKGGITIKKRLELEDYWQNKFGETLRDSIKNEKEHLRSIPGTKENDIRSDYPTKDPGTIWNEWSEKQRFHFLHDHRLSLNKNETIKKEYKDIDNKTFKDRLRIHINSGRYQEGDKIKSQTNYDKSLMLFKESTKAIDDFQITDYGIELTPYEISDEYRLRIRMTKNELLSSVIKSLKKENPSFSDEDIKTFLIMMTDYLFKEA